MYYRLFLAFIISSCVSVVGLSTFGVSGFEMHNIALASPQSSHGVLLAEKSTQ